ncbi:glycoside hydrolase family 32 protein [Staphylococcus canis]|uniref:beta-fructofuranosidase n=1 Tax=Staphylococcus canis TaxID=2724942 RepID=A0ABS0T8M8_9STAP|nr:GH32 C-terminal domain-containing protein [Staphylococcus canis]MBI5974797.1 sucrose-6-phosphate hydrolase [Staphylococcus canis]
MTQASNQHHDVSIESTIQDNKSSVPHTSFSPYQQKFHIQPQSGDLKGPSGIVFNKGDYEITYQWLAEQAVALYQMTSENLVDFKTANEVMTHKHFQKDIRVSREHAFVFNKTIYYMYTRYSKTEADTYLNQQVISKKDEDGQLGVKEHVFIPHAPKGYQNLEHPSTLIRDDKLYVVIGAQREDLTGCVLLYQAEHPEAKWTFLGEIKTELKTMESTWQYPELFQLSGKDILLFLPKMHQQSEMTNVNQSGYIIGHLDFDTLQFQHEPFQLLDHGFDFDAPQTFVDEVGRRVMIASMNHSDVVYPTDHQGSANCLTLPRTLMLEEGKLKQKPYMNLRKLRGEKETALGYANKFVKQLHPYDGTQYELVVDILENEAQAFEFQLRATRDEYVVVRYQSKTKEVILDRFDSGKLPVGCASTKTLAVLPSDLYQLRIFVDTTSIEVFCNEGERVLTSRIFPTQDGNKIRVSTDSGQVYLNIAKYDLSSVD